MIARFLLVGLLIIPALDAAQAREPEAPVALVNGQPITWAELERASNPKIQAGSLAEAKRFQHHILDALIDRELIIQSFYKQGRHVPDDTLDQKLSDIVKNEFGGNRAAFEQTMQDRGITVALYRREIADNMIVTEMRSRNVTDKITADACPASLRKNAKIEIYLP